MREDSSFETVKIDLSKELDGLDDEIDLGAGNWITFGYIPSDVQVFFALDNNSSSKIQAKQGLQIKVPHSKVYLWSVGTNATEQMEIMHWGSSDIQMIMPPRSDFDSLNGYGSLALTQLDKIINPYELTRTRYDKASNTSLTTILSYTLDCDRIIVTLTGGYYKNNPYQRDGGIRLYLNTNFAGEDCGRSFSNSQPYYSSTVLEFNNIRGTLLELKEFEKTSDYESAWRIEEYTLK